MIGSTPPGYIPQDAQFQRIVEQLVLAVNDVESRLSAVKMVIAQASIGRQGPAQGLQALQGLQGFQGNVQNLPFAVGGVQGVQGFSGLPFAFNPQAATPFGYVNAAGIPLNLGVSAGFAAPAAPFQFY